MAMDEEDIKIILEENSKLRELLEQHRERELAELRQRTLDAEAKVEHYRNEAQRNADLGRQIAAEYERKIVELQAKVDSYERTATARPPIQIGR
jgi:hypothetical protein